METTNGNGNGNVNQDAMIHSAGCSSIFTSGWYDRKCLRCTKIERVVALRRKTVARGCSIEEESAAANLATRLVNQYVLTDDELHDAPYERERQDAIRRAQAEAAQKARAEAEAKAQAARDAREARAFAANVARGIAEAARAQANAQLDARKAEVANAEAALKIAADALKAARDALALASKVAGAKAPKQSTGTRARSTSAQSTGSTGTQCFGDTDTCPCRRHAAKRAWETMRNAGYVNGKKPGTQSASV